MIKMIEENQICECGHKSKDHVFPVCPKDSGGWCSGNWNRRKERCPCKKFEPKKYNVYDVRDTSIEGCGKEFDQDHGTPIYCGMELSGRLELCENCKPQENKGLRIIDGTPSSISKLIREQNHGPEEKN